MRRLFVARAVKCSIGLVLLCSTVLAATGASSSASTGPKKGGSLTVLEIASQWPGLDPPTNNQDAADVDYENAIFGQLFEQGPGTSVIDDMAQNYKTSDGGLVITINLRKGLTFSDGTPYTAADVVTSVQQDLLPANGCLCDFDFAVLSSISSNGPYQVILHLSHPSATIIESFVSEAPNWTVDPTALASMGEPAYAQHPIGAGPFEVVSNEASASLVLKRNPLYWQKGHPYLNSLTFESVANETSGVAGVESGSAQLMTGGITEDTLRQADHAGLLTPAISGVIANSIQLNDKIAPFNNPLARDAVYYATDSKQIMNVINSGVGKVVECPCGPGSLDYEAKVPGYRTYDLSKAKALVSQLGGLTTQLMVLNTPTGEQAGEVIATQWEAAGIKVTIVPDSLQSVINAYISNSWTATTEAGGGIDPEVGVQALSTRDSSKGIFSGTTDSTVDNLIAQSEETLNSANRGVLIHKIYALLASDAYNLYTYSAPQQVVMTKTLGGVLLVPGQLGPAINYENVYIK
jgi:peptide/nickel transport system substrate-binding protein